MKKIKLLKLLLLIVFFPLGIIYCIGKNLFGGGFASFLGGIFLFAVGFIVALYFLRYDLVKPVIGFIQTLF